ncbi:MAG TPA: phage tail tape measure protein [Thermoguttaceae bacterium]|nr:phage tail tape measure protein [Thermoguttaceae bacterium]
MKAGRAYVELYTQDGKLNKGLASAQAKLRAFGAGVQAVGARFLALGGAMAAPLAGAVKAASDMAETMGKFDTVFGRNATTVKAWSDNLAGTLGRSKQQIADFMAGSQDLFVPLGFDEGAALAMSQQVTQLAVDLASFNHAADDDALRDLHAALTGSGEVMKKYGVIVSEAAVKQELLNQGIKAGTDQQKVQARLAIIMRGTTAAQGDALRTAGSFANQMKALKARVSDTAVAIGSALLPILTPLVSRVANIVKVIGQWVQRNQQVVVNMLKMAAGLITAGAAMVVMGTALRVVSTALIAFRVALAAVTKHPFVILATAVAAVATLFVDWGMVLRKFTGELNRANSVTRVSADAMRGEAEALSAKVKRLEELRTKQGKSNLDQAEALAIARELKGAYPGLTREIDAIGTAAGSTAGLMAKMTDAMVLQTQVSLKKQLADGAAAYRALKKEADDYAQTALDLESGKLTIATARKAVTGVLTGTSKGEVLAELRTATREAYGAAAEQAKANTQAGSMLADLKSMPAGGGVTGGEGIAQEAEAWEAEQRRFSEIVAGWIDDEQQRELRLIQLKYEAEITEAERAGRETLRLRATQWQEEALVKARYAKEAAEAAADFEAGLADDIARLDIEANFEGLNKDLALLELDRRKAIQEATAAGYDFSGITRKFDLQRDLLKRAAIDPKLSVTGTFSAAAASRLGGGGGKQLDKLVDNTKETNRAVARVERAVERFAPQFT